MNWYSFLVSTTLFLSFGLIEYNSFKNYLNFIILFWMETKKCISSFNSIVRKLLSVISFTIILFVMELLMYHISLMYGMSHFWYDLFIPQFGLILNGLSKSHMLDTHLGLHKNVYVESLSNRLIYFILNDCADEQFNPAIQSPDLISCLINYFHLWFYHHRSLTVSIVGTFLSPTHIWESCP